MIGPVAVAGKLEAGTVAVSVLLLTNVVSANCAPFQRMNAPVTNPDPLAVIGSPLDGMLPIVAVAGLRNDSDEEDV